jgi:serine/threonine-protein kinase
MPTPARPTWSPGSDSRDLPSGRGIGGFKILGLIGQGGMAKVYRAEQASLGRTVALKVLEPCAVGFEPAEWERRFYLEASACSQLKHPNTVTIFDFGGAPGGAFYIAMELLEGRTLLDLVRREGPLPANRAVHIARQIARSLREAHGAGIIHCDLKPANVFLVPRDDDLDFVKVLDFGLLRELNPRAELRQDDSMRLGTPKYMAPEQIRDDTVDARCDIYSLGVMLREMLTGRPVFSGRRTVEILIAHLRQPVPRLRDVAPTLDVPDALDDIVQRCVAKSVDSRYSSMHELLGALRALAEPGDPLPMAEDSQSLPVSLFERQGTIRSLPNIDFNSASRGPLAPRRQRSRHILAVLALIGLAGAAGAGVWLASPQAQPESPPVAEAVAQPMRLLLRSTPGGAAVRVGAEVVCPTTPCELIWPAERAGKTSFQFVLAGSPDVLVTRELTGHEVTVSARFVRPAARRPARARPEPRRRPVRPKKKDKEPVLSGYKDNPYD